MHEIVRYAHCDAATAARLMRALAAIQTMRTVLAIALLSALASCATTGNGFPSLEPELPDEPLVDRIRFYLGSWIWPRSIYAFHISANDIFVVKRSDHGNVSYQIVFSDCRELSSGFEKLKSAALDTLAIAAGLAESHKSDVIVMDGPTYELEFYSRDVSGQIGLEGGGNAQNVSEWIDAALSIRQIEESCNDS